MQTITIEMSDQSAREMDYYLRRRYGKNKNTSLSTLILLAAKHEKLAAARDELAEIEQSFSMERNDDEHSN